MFISLIKYFAGFFTSIAVMVVMFIFNPSTALADTDGSELRITNQPDKLVLNLGADWAGSQFELTLDAVKFPFPVAVDDSGILNMELGGSKIYTLTLLDPNAVVEQPTQLITPSSAPNGTLPQPNNTIPDTPIEKSTVSFVPVLHMLAFFGGLAVAVGGLVLIRIIKKRRAEYENENEEEDDDEYR
jgi:hypothetical protein